MPEIKIFIGVYIIGTIIMFIDFPIGISVVSLSIALYSLIQFKKTDKYNIQILNLLHGILEELKQLKNMNKNSHKTNNSSKKKIRNIKNSTSINFVKSNSKQKSNNISQN